MVTSVAVLSPRAFLALPRVWRDPRAAGLGRARRHHGATLLEAPWPEQKSTTISRMFSRNTRQASAPHAFPSPQRQEIGRCSCLQSAVQVAVAGPGAGFPHLLWVLDSGEADMEGAGTSAQCPPKVVVYNLHGKNQEVLVQPFDGVPHGALSGLAVDSHGRDTRAYVGYPGGGGLVVVSLRGRSCWLVRLSGTGAGAPLLPKVPRFMRVPVWDLALLTSSSRWPRLLVTARESEEILDLPLQAVRSPAPEDRRLCGRGGSCRLGEWLPAMVLAPRHIGRKLGPGPSAGLLGDPLGGLHYFLVGVPAAVRWDPREGAGPAGHRVQLQHALAEALFLDQDGGVWAANTFAPSSGRNHCVLLQNGTKVHRRTG